MKLFPYAAALLLGASTAAFAQAQAPAPVVDVPKHKCEPKPTLPGERMMQEANVRKRFQSDVDNYKVCMRVYSEERNATAKAHIDAANEAINEYNVTIKTLQDAQKAR